MNPVTERACVVCGQRSDDATGFWRAAWPFGIFQTEMPGHPQILLLPQEWLAMGPVDFDVQSRVLRKTQVPPSGPQNCRQAAPGGSGWSYTVETAYKVYVCPRGNLLYCRPYFINNLIISVNISFLLKPPAYPHGKSLFTSHFELNNWCKWSKEPKQMQTKLPFPAWEKLKSCG